MLDFSSIVNVFRNYNSIQYLNDNQKFNFHTFLINELDNENVLTHI